MINTKRERQIITASISAVLDIRDLNVSMLKSERRQSVLRKVNLRVDAGEIVVVIGRSGSGKSTLAHVINGLLPIDSFPEVNGSIRIVGSEIVGATNAELKKARKTLIRVIPQDPLDALNPTMCLGRQLAEACSMREAKERLRWAGIDNVERITRSFPHELSGGERQRALIAMATVSDVPLIVADEPTTGLDPRNKSRIIALLKELAASGTAVLINTHDLGVAESSDRMIVLDSGTVVEAGIVSEVLRRPRHQSTASLIAARYDRWNPQSLMLSEAENGRGIEVAEQHRPRLKSASSLPPAVDTREAVLSMKQVSKTFENRRFFRVSAVNVLSSIDLTVRAGECVALIGDSGVGKSTLLKVAAGLLKQNSGVVTRNCGDRAQLIFQDAKSFLTPWVPIGEQIIEGLRSKNTSANDRYEKLLEMMDFVGLEQSQSKALPYELSVGQCQRAVIARSLVVSPHLLLCDEPISALDTVLAASTLKLLRQIRLAYGTAMLLATHDHAAAQVAADRIYTLRAGKLFNVTGEVASLDGTFEIGQSQSC